MRILLVEDSVALQEAIAKGFERLGVAVDVVGDGAEGLSRALHNPYDVLVLDLMLPGMDGLRVLEELRRKGSDLHVLVLTARDTLDDRVTGLQRGADDYLVKPFDFAELAARAQALARRKYREKRPCIEVGDLRVDTAARQVHRGGERVDLTKREYALLEYLAFRKGQPVHRIEIEDHLYGTDRLPSSNAVDAAVYHLRAKLARHGEGALIHTRRGVGYVLEDAS